MPEPQPQHSTPVQELDAVRRNFGVLDFSNVKLSPEQNEELKALLVQGKKAENEGKLQDALRCYREYLRNFKQIQAEQEQTQQLEYSADMDAYNITGAPFEINGAVHYLVTKEGEEKKDKDNDYIIGPLGEVIIDNITTEGEQTIVGNKTYIHAQRNFSDCFIDQTGREIGRNHFVTRDPGEYQGKLIFIATNVVNKYEIFNEEDNPITPEHDEIADYQVINNELYYVSSDEHLVEDLCNYVVRNSKGDELFIIDTAKKVKTHAVDGEFYCVTREVVRGGKEKSVIYNLNGEVVYETADTINEEPFVTVNGELHFITEREDGEYVCNERGLSSGPYKKVYNMFEFKGALYYHCTFEDQSVLKRAPDEQVSAPDQRVILSYKNIGDHYYYTTDIDEVGLSSRNALYQNERLITDLPKQIGRVIEADGRPFFTMEITGGWHVSDEDENIYSESYEHIWEFKKISEEKAYIIAERDGIYYRTVIDLTKPVKA